MNVTWQCKFYVFFTMHIKYVPSYRYASALAFGNPYTVSILETFLMKLRCLLI